ncbi:MAG: autotransporter adhesin family protein [Lachnospiraceae bacterium]|nr:autotransporter adhesin family protein [Lachnospiraceae bacterium]
MVKRIVSLLLANTLIVSGFGLYDNARHADAAIVAAAATPTPVSSSEDIEGTVEELEQGAEILDDENGRISFWEWDKCTPANWKKFFGDHEFHPVMLAYYGFNKSEPYGFVSIYGDKYHLFRGTGAPSDLEKYPDYIFKSCTNNVNTGWFDQFRTGYMVLDDDSKLLNGHKEYFNQDRFYTTGGTMGVLFFRNPKNATTFTYPQFDIAFSRASSKNKPEDMSYLEIGTGVNKKEDYFMYVDCVDRDSSDGENGEPYIYFDHNSLNDGYSSFRWAMGANYLEKSKGSNDIPNNLTDRWCFYGVPPTVSWMSNIIVNNGYMHPMYRMQLPISQRYYDDCEYDFNHFNSDGNVKRHYEDILRSNDLATEYKMFVGSHHVLASIKGENGDETSGQGGTTTIGEGQMLIIDDATFIDSSGHTSKSEGIILPETSTIIIEKGGVLSVQGNLINNGTIINKGGTIIVKDGGCISPYAATSEGMIKCLGGDMIVMPGGKVFALSSDKAQNTSESVVGISLLSSDDGGSSLINYGFVANTRCEMDASSTIENRNEGAFLSGVTRVTDNKLLYNSEINISSEGTKTTVKCSDLKDVSFSSNPYIGIFSITNDGTQKGTVLNYLNAFFSYVYLEGISPDITPTPKPPNPTKTPIPENATGGAIDEEDEEEFSDSLDVLTQFSGVNIIEMKY